jgi:hypothetical protein
VIKNMEEIVTVSGKQFKLTTDRPLTALERQQTIEQIQKQTGCSSCGSKALTLGGYGGIQSLAACAAGPKSSGDTVTLTANPYGGVRPYTVNFYRKLVSGAFQLLGTTTLTAGDPESTAASTSFVLTDLDVASADGIPGELTPTASTTGALTAADGAMPLSTGYIRVATTVFDQCPTGPQTCVEWCDVSLACVPPTCNFVVT